MRTVLFALLLLFTVPAYAQMGPVAPLMVDLAEKSVNITTGFTGANLSLFGVKEQPGDIAIVIQGPERRMVVRRKNQVMGIWMNTDSLDFRNVPIYYDLALSRAEKDIASPEVLNTYNVGLDALNIEAVGGEDAEEAEKFKEALIRNKQIEGHFPLEPKNIIFLSNNFFRADFYMPANVPTGDYLIETYLFQNGSVLDKRETKLHVGQVGFSADIYRFAHRESFVYGLLSVLLAVMAGTSAWAFMRKE